MTRVYVRFPEKRLSVLLLTPAHRVLFYFVVQIKTRDYVFFHFYTYILKILAFINFFVTI